MNDKRMPENVLYIDLSKKSFKIEKRPQLFRENLGGIGVAMKLLLEECPQGIDPFDPQNPIVFAVGPLTCLFPLASKTVAVFKSPHTGNLGESHAGGRSAVSIRMAGYGAIVIKGASNIPVYLAIHGDKVYFRDASTLWGMGSNFTVGRVIREHERGAGLRTIMRIGRAGENLVSYACVTTESYRHFGRLGLGAVFGSKKLKALVVSGKSSIQLENSGEYRKLYDEIYREAVESEVMKKYHDLGTSSNILPLNELGALPNENLRTARSIHAGEISGERFAEDFLGRRLACSHCPVGCIHIAALREPYEDEPYFYKTSMISYDYEPIYAIGNMLGSYNPAGILKLMDRIEALGLDVMSTGVVLAWATEAMEEGLISKKETTGLNLKWGYYQDYIQATEYITSQPNEFYRVLAKGVENASEKYGGEDYALAYGGNEMPGYHTGPAAHIGFAVGTRHSHLDNAGYSIDQKHLGEKLLSPEELGENLLKEERWRQILCSLVLCLFARGIYTPERTTRALLAAGADRMDEKALMELGKKIHSEKYKFKIKEGYMGETAGIPQRVLQTPSPWGKLDEEYIRKTISYIHSASLNQ